MKRDWRKAEKLQENIYQALERHDFSKAEVLAERLSHYDFLAARQLQTAMEIEKGNPLQADTYWQDLKKNAPEDTYTLFLQARIFVQQHRYQSAWKILQNLQKREIELVYQEKVYNLAGQCCRVLGRPKQAAEYYYQAYQSVEETPLQAVEYSDYLFNLHYLELSLEEQRVAAAGFAKIYQTYKPLEPPVQEQCLKIRIGYLSPDFRRHVVLPFIYAMLTQYDREKFEVFAYANGPEDAYSRHLADVVTGWRNITNLSDEAAARQIRLDQINILVDLAGHTKGNRLGVLAYRPAGVQLSGIGYFSSTGMKAVDYFLSDRILARENAQQGFVEKLLPLPHSHFCYVPLKNIKESKNAPCLEKGYVTLTSFNNFTKVNDRVLVVWNKIMKRLPQAHLLLKAAVFDYEESRTLALQRLQDAGMDMERVEWRGISENYLEEYGETDIALDTFPYPGGGTTCDALYMGVPVVTLTGESQGERFGESLLINIGLGELVATTVEEYIERVVALAGNRELLQLLHQNLRTMMRQSAVMDSKQYMEELEAAYQRVYMQKVSKSISSNNYGEQVTAALDAGDLVKATTILANWQSEDAKNPYGQLFQAELFFQQQKYELAKIAAQRALEADLSQAYQGVAFHRLAEIAKIEGKYEDAAGYFLKSSQYKHPESGQWAEYSNYLLALQYTQSSAANRYQAAVKYDSLFSIIQPFSHDPAKHHHKRLKVGYISPDFREHVVACFCRAFFAAYDKNVFEVYGYCLCEENPVSRDLAEQADHWRMLSGMELGEAAACIYNDEIDILVDLSGHTGNNALPILAFRPAPVQLSGIGYFATTGLSTVDYFLTDCHTAKAEEQQYFTEQLIRLPHSHFCYSPWSGAEPINPVLPSSRNGYITFGSFNNLRKISDDCLAVWAKILNRIEGAKLLLKGAGGIGTFQRHAACKRLLEQGLSLDQVIFEEPSSDYMAWYNEVDIALDTYPYPGGGTTCDALYMGVPVIALAGKSHHERFGVSFLRNVDCGDLCAENEAQYVELAVLLARDVFRRKSLHHTLRWRMQSSCLMDAEAYMTEWEAACQDIWRRWQKQELGKKEDELKKELLRQAYEQREWQTVVPLAFWLRDDAGDEFPGRVLAFAYYQLKDYIRAAYWAKRQQQVHPDDEQMAYFQASSLEVKGNLLLSLAICRQYFVAEFYAYPEVYRNMAYVYALDCFRLGTQDMSESYWQAYKANPQNLDMYSSWLLSFNNCEVDENWLYQCHLDYGKLVETGKVYHHDRHRHQHRRLRVGYISPDFRQHVMFHFYLPMFVGYDAERFEIYAYSLTAKKDGYTEQVCAMTDHWRDISGMSAAEAAQKIYGDEIDILFDLAGHTADSPLPILACKPAPVQISGLGYMATTGLRAVDYFLTDSFVDPAGMNESYFVENLLRLTSQFCYSGVQEDLPVSTGAPSRTRGYIVFGVFNAYRKYTDEILSVWREILEQVAGARLLIKSQILYHPAVCIEAYQRFAAAGLDMERVIFEQATTDYMNRYLDVDIALDTYPYPGGGTTCDALYMGVPVISRYGSRHSSRFSYSILQNIGLGELAVTSWQAYVQRAVTLARDVDLLDLLHRNLRTMMKQSAVMDVGNYMHELEREYQKIWKQYEKSV